MKNNNYLTVLMIVLAFSLSATSQAQNFKGLDKSPMDASTFPSSYKISDKVVKVVYGRPQLKNRDLATLAPVGKVYRTGANEAAEITFYKDVTFGGKKVAAGTYSLFTIPGEKKWTVILNKALNVWGAYTYDESDDVLRVEGTVSKSEKSIEAFSIVFEGEGTDFNMYIGWGNTIVTVPIKA
ncbi:DUF2911 domain-containing protein [Flavobacteriaceae bacterium F08102]|nr:DUF2911 domain-containing protein [Flavobacteriaceae bacterium F08102]